MMILDEGNRKNLIFLILQFLDEEGYEESFHSLEQESGLFFNPVRQKFNKSALLSLISFICPNRRNEGGLKEDLIWLILQFLHESNYNNTMHELEEEAKVFFNLNHFVTMMTQGEELDKAEEYLGAFTDSDDKNKYSRAMFLEIQKLKSLENDMSSLPRAKQKLYVSVALLAQKNPLLKDKLDFPFMEKSRLLKLMKQTVEWWFQNFNKSLENIPVVSYLCGHTCPMKKKVVVNDNPSQCNALILPEYSFSEERIAIARLSYSVSADYILALAEDGTHKLWTWSKSNVFPEPRQIAKTMRNEIGTATSTTTSCFAIKGSYIFSTSGSRISVFDLKSYEKVAAFGSGTPTATYLIFIPGDLLAVGLEDGSIFIYCLWSRKVKAKLEGGHDHQRITCLAFSCCFNVLVSSDANGKLCVWCAKSWAKLTSNNHESSSLVTHVEFDPYQIELLVVHGGWIGVHKAPSLDCLVKWFPHEASIIITCATYSCGGEIYVGFTSGYVNVLDSSTFQMISRINLTALIKLEVYPTVVVAHPSHPSQISVGLSNGNVIVLQPLEIGGWGEGEAASSEEEDNAESDNSLSSTAQPEEEEDNAESDNSLSSTAQPEEEDNAESDNSLSSTANYLP